MSECRVLSLSAASSDGACGRRAVRRRAGQPSRVKATIEWALDSTYLRIDDRSANSLFGNFLNFGMLGFDSPTGAFFLSMFNNFGDHPSYRGSFAGDTLVFHASIPSPRGTFEQEVRWMKEGENLRMQVYNDRGKGKQLTIDQVSTPAH